MKKFVISIVTTEHGRLTINKFLMGGINEVMTNISDACDLHNLRPDVLRYYKSVLESLHVGERFDDIISTPGLITNIKIFRVHAEGNQ
jgi:hypothetical protein